MSKGGPEAVAESAYSLMKHHKMCGSISNRRLAQRTKLDWCLPRSVVSIPNTIKLIAEKHLAKHKSPVLSFSDSRTKFRFKSKVIERLQKGNVTSRVPIFD